MILVDTSVWVHHLRTGHERLATFLRDARVLVHPFVVGELACGNLQNRAEVLQLLGDLPQAKVASQREVLFFIEKNALMGCGIGFIDAHLLAAAALGGTVHVWTADRRLQRAAAGLGLAYSAAG